MRVVVVVVGVEVAPPALKRAACSEPSIRASCIPPPETTRQDESRFVICAHTHHSFVVFVWLARPALTTAYTHTHTHTPLDTTGRARWWSWSLERRQRSNGRATPCVCSKSPDRPPVTSSKLSLWGEGAPPADRPHARTSRERYPCLANLCESVRRAISFGRGRGWIEPNTTRAR